MLKMISLKGLTSHCPHAGPAQGAAHEPVNEPVDDDVEIPVETADQLETRKKTKAGKPERKEKRAEGKATESPRKRPSTLPILDYVVVSDKLSGLGAGEKHRGSDPDDSATLTEMMRKKALEDKKRKLDEKAAVMLASKRARLQKEAPTAPSESEIDMGVFSGNRGNLLEEIYAASAPTGKGFVIVSSRARRRAGLIFQRSLLLPLPCLGPSSCLLPMMIWVRRRNKMM
ncbi:hypothetical protein HanRHA438_Chr12g0546821 [Helianthus annuus]|nr:hypothetical protein HanRHA438_Chr12g0546821 [Helianthus annuus]